MFGIWTFQSVLSEVDARAKSEEPPHRRKKDVMIDTASSGFRAVDPATGIAIEPEFAVSTAADVAAACAAADAAHDAFKDLAPERRARFLEEVAARIEALGQALILRAMAETALPEARLIGERGRTVGQLRLFARVVREGRWAGLTIDRAMPARQPAPRADLRLRKMGIGPVAVFGASNFPLAFSVAGGDTASAWAAGCPVIVRGHPAHPGTSALVAGAIAAAITACGLPAGVFALIQGPAHGLGAALVADPRIKAVGFTGSRQGGLALQRIARERPEPIPVFAEMSSVNPVLLFPHALAERPEALARDYVASLTLGAGQFCTNPGIVLAPVGEGLDCFAAAAAAALSAVAPQAMLTPAIRAAYEQGVAARAEGSAAEQLAQGRTAGPGQVAAALFAVGSAEFLADARLEHELFGPSSILVRCDDIDVMAAVVARLEGQLTVTLQLADADIIPARPLIPLLERKAGRIVVNGWPTGVEVCDAMVHGGPFPATSDPRFTSVGTLAIDRFLRPVCYQDMPAELLPDPLRDGSFEECPHKLDGHLT